MSLKSKIVAQFKHPRGWLGHVAGWTMAHRTSNIARNKWTVGLLNLEDGHRVLEFGCGPGVALGECVGQIGHGFVVGVDHSDAMIEQAGHRLLAEIAAGRVELSRGDLSSLARFDQDFDRVFSLNVIQFLPDMEAVFARFSACLKPGGICATTYQPRSGQVTRAAAIATAEKIENAMRAVGFADIARHELDLKPVPAICVTGARPSVGD